MSARENSLTLIHSQDLIGNFSYYLPYNSYDASPENLVLDQLIGSLFIKLWLGGHYYAIIVLDRYKTSFSSLL